LIGKAQQDNKIHGISIAINAPLISHLIYVDDNILFCRARPEEAKTIMEVLRQYQEASGQKVNLDKSETIFSPNISVEAKKMFQENLPVRINDKITKYLGMPTHFGRSKERDFNFIMVWIWIKLKGWKEKSLSFEGMGVVIRFVDQAIPTYYMRCFLLPKVLCNKIEKVICSFWWGTTGTKKKSHWNKRENSFKSKHEGGLGFKILRDFNTAMLAKQVWGFHTNPGTLISRCFKDKYFPHLDVLQAPIGNNPSYAWRSFNFLLGILLEVADGGLAMEIRLEFGGDNWIPNHNSFKVMSPVKENSNVNMVKDLITTKGPS